MNDSNFKNETSSGESYFTEPDAISRFLNNSHDRIKIELIPQVFDDSFNYSETVVYVNNENIVKNDCYEQNYDVKEETDHHVSYEGDIQLNLTVCNNDSEDNNRNKNIMVTDYSTTNRARSPIIDYVSENIVNECIDYSTNSDKENNYINGYDSDTKSSLKDELIIDEENKLIIDEGYIKEEEYPPLPQNSNDFVNEIQIPLENSSPENCILLRTLTAGNPIPHVNGVYYSPERIAPSDYSRKYFPEMDENIVYETISPSQIQGENSNSPSPKSSTRRKQKCPTRSSTVASDSGTEYSEEIVELTSMQQPNPEATTNISPIPVSEREEVISYSQIQFLDEVLSRHSSPATTPPIIPQLHSERLHKACDVLLRAASKIDHAYPSKKSSRNKVKLEKNVPQDPKQPQKQCSNCRAVQTTIWRRDRFGNIVCNPCGLYYKLHNFDRPCRMRRDEIHKRNRKRNAMEMAKMRRNSKSTEVPVGEQENDLLSLLGSHHPNYARISSIYTMNANGVPKKRRMYKKLASAVQEEPLSSPMRTYKKSSAVKEEPLSLPMQSDSLIVKKSSSLQNNQDSLRMMAAFQMSRKFLPINPPSSTPPVDYNNGLDENSFIEAPLNLAANSH